MISGLADRGGSPGFDYDIMTLFSAQDKWTTPPGQKISGRTLEEERGESERVCDIPLTLLYPSTLQTKKKKRLLLFFKKERKEKEKRAAYNADGLLLLSVPGTERIGDTLTQ